MHAFFSKLPQMLFAPSRELAQSYLDEAVDLADLERREAALEAERRGNFEALH